MKPPIALTMGDPSGVSGEITAEAWAALRSDPTSPFVLIGDPDWIAHFAPVSVVSSLSDAEDCFAEAMPVMPLPCATPPVAGRPDPANAKSIISSITEAVAHVQAGRASAMVTNPINKKGLKDGADFAHPGHTEFLGALAGVERPVMMLAAPQLRVVPVTIHIALKDVAEALTPALLEDTLRVTHAGLIRDCGIASPRVAVAGLNPHAGEGGAMGREEIEIIKPVLDRLRIDGMNITGPHSADTLFHPAARATYDVAVCMYHDQALIPIKTVDFAGGVNVTLGLPFIRTSPDHGTAYDIAGQDKADPTSLIAALKLAGQMAGKRI